MRLGLRTKLIIFGLAFAVLPLVIAVLPSIARFQSVQQESVLQHEAQIAQSAAEEVSHFLELQYQHLEETGLFFREIEEDPSRGDLYVERILFRNDSFTDISVVDASGQEIMRKHRYQVIREEDFRDRSDDDAYQTVRSGEHYLSSVYFDQGRPFFTIGTPVEDAQGEVIGGLFAEVDARILQEVVREVSVSHEERRAYIINEEGVVIGHPNISTVLSRTNFSSIPLIAHILRGETERYDESYQNDEGQMVLGSWSDISIPIGNEIETQWYVVSEENAGYALRHVREVIWFAVGALSVVLLILVPGVFLVSNHILVPIRKVHAFVDKVGEGDFSKRVDVDVNDEIGDMARGVNDMVVSLKKARERDALISRMKSEFLSIAAHQLRTPLSALKWTFNMMLEGDMGKLTKKQKDFLGRGNDTTERIIKLVNDLLNVSRIEEGKFGYEFTEVSLADVAETIIHEQAPVAEEKKLTLELHTPRPSVPLVKADEEKISLAITNLVDNALKYTPAGGRVDVYLEKQEESVLVRVVDTGVGIPKGEDTSRLFTKFYRGEKAQKLQTDGSGLGLFLVKNIVEAHGGDIWAESEEGNGTTFYMTIPRSAHES